MTIEEFYNFIRYGNDPLTYQEAENQLDDVTYAKLETQPLPASAGSG